MDKSTWMLVGAVALGVLGARVVEEIVVWGLNRLSAPVEVVKK